MIRSPWGRRLLGRLFSRRSLAVQAGTALVAGTLLAAASPASAVTPASEPSSYTAFDGTPPNGGNSTTTPPPNGGKNGQKNHKNGHKNGNGDGFEGCIDSSQQSNEKFLVYVPERDSLWVWKENRGAGTVDPWVQFTETGATNAGVPIPEGVVCATIVNKANTVAITVVTQNNSDQQVWQTECTVNPDNASNPFDPNERCEDFEELTPLPTNNVGNTSSSDSNSSNNSSYGPNTGDGATAATSGVPGAATMVGGALLGLALTVALRRRRGNIAA